MNIKTALDLLKAIDESNKQAKAINSLLDQRNEASPGHVTVQVFNAKGDRYSCDHSNYCVIHPDLLREAVNKTAERYKAEAEKLQPVIDMAEAALRGVLATGESK